MTVDLTPERLGDMGLLDAERSGRPVFVVDRAGRVVWAGPLGADLIADGLHPSVKRALGRMAAARSSGPVVVRLGAEGRRAKSAFEARPLDHPNGASLLAVEAVARSRATVARPAARDAIAADPPPDSRRISSAHSGPTSEPAADASVSVGRGDPDAGVKQEASASRGAARQPEKTSNRLDQASLRFIFETDADGRFTYLSPDLERTVGESARAAWGAQWDEFAAAYGVDPSGAVREALATRSGWGEIIVGWPGFDGRRFPVALSALPMFDRGRQFAGFRGLGRAVPPAAAPRIAPEPAPESARTVPAGLATDGVKPDETLCSGNAPDLSASTQPEPTLPEDQPEASPQSERQDRTAQPSSARDADQVGVPQIDPTPTARGQQLAAKRDEPPAIVEAPPAIETFTGNVVPLRDMSPRLAGLTWSEESAFDEIARRLKRIDERDAPPAPATIETAEIAAAPLPGADWTIDDLDGRAPTSSRLDDLLGLLDRQPMGAVVLRAGEIDYANRAALDMLGHRDLPSLQARGVGALFAEPPARDDAAPATVRMVSDDGLEIEAEAKLQTVTWRGGPATLVSLRRAEGAVANALAAIERERETASILDATADGVVTLDGAGRVLAVNRSAEALFGIEGRDVIGSLFTLSLAPESRKAAFDALDRQRAAGGPSAASEAFEVLGLSRQGGAVPLQMTLGRVGPAEADRFCAVLRDVSPWKRTEEELIAARRQAERANAQKSDFLAKVGREIRTPLNAIMGFAAVMMEERFGPIGNPRYRHYLRDIQVSGAHLISLVNDLLDITRVESGAMTLEFTAVDLNEIAAQAAALLQPQASRDHVIIRTSLARAMPPVLADRRSIRQIMTNLASNAVKFSRPGGQVILATALTDVGQAVIRVRDAGAGMTKQELARAFEPFRPLADNDPGGGLGLPLTKALAEANEAALALQSELGRGTLAEVTFPASRVLAG